MAYLGHATLVSNRRRQAISSNNKIVLRKEFYVDDMLKKANKYDGNNCDIKRNQGSVHKGGILTLMSHYRD